jgi:hypothetical protein
MRKVHYISHGMINFFFRAHYTRQVESNHLSNFCSKLMSILMVKLKEWGSPLVERVLSILQYADDTVLFMAHDLEKARNLKLILSAFGQLSAFKINFHKSELFCFG